NPASSCGIPFLAQWNTMALYPPSLFYLVLPLPWSFGIFCLGHLFLAGMGMYFLAWRWTGNRLAAAIAGAVFGFNGFIWYGLMWPHILAALAWMPWLVIAFEEALQQGGSACIQAAVIAALQLLTGGAEVILQTWLLLAALFVVHVCKRQTRPGRLIARISLPAVLALGLSAAQLLPFLDLLEHSQRNSGYGAGGAAKIGAMPLSGWLNCVVPLFHCAPNAQGVYMQNGQSWTASYYLGIGTLALAAVGAWRSRDWRPRLLAALTLFGLLMALGSRAYIYDFVKRVVPLLGFLRFPVKFMVLPVFAMPLLAAFGLGALSSSQARPRSPEWAFLRRVSVVLIGLVAAIIGFVWMHAAVGESPWVVTGNAFVRALFLCLVIGCLAPISGQIKIKHALLPAVCLITLFWLDVLTHSPNLSPTVPTSALAPDVIRQFFKWDDQLRPGTSRAMLSQSALWKMLSTGVADPEQDTTGRRLSLSMDYNLLDHVAKFDGFYSLDLKEYLELFKRVYFMTNQADPLKDFLGVSRVTSPDSVVDWTNRSSFLPLVTAGQSPIFSDEPRTLEALFSPGFDPRHSVYLPLEARDEIHATQSSARAVLTHFSAHELRIEAEAEAPALIVVAQSFYHPWRAFVDGQPSTLWRANYAFQAVEVPAGKHQVRLVYVDRAFQSGCAVSAVSL